MYITNTSAKMDWWMISYKTEIKEIVRNVLYLNILRGYASRDKQHGKVQVSRPASYNIDIHIDVWVLTCRLCKCLQRKTGHHTLEDHTIDFQVYQNDAQTCASLLGNAWQKKIDLCSRKHVLYPPTGWNHSHHRFWVHPVFANHANMNWIAWWLKGGFRY